MTSQPSYLRLDTVSDWKEAIDELTTRTLNKELIWTDVSCLQLQPSYLYEFAGVSINVYRSPPSTQITINSSHSPAKELTTEKSMLFGAIKEQIIANVTVPESMSSSIESLKFDARSVDSLTRIREVAKKEAADNDEVTDVREQCDNLLEALGIQDVDRICSDVVIVIPIHGRPTVELTYRCDNGVKIDKTFGLRAMEDTTVRGHAAAGFSTSQFAFCPDSTEEHEQASDDAESGHQQSRQHAHNKRGPFKSFAERLKHAIFPVEA